MKIATWNINGLRARIEFMQIWLKDRQPDVVGLQELKTTDDEFPADVFEELGYTCVTHGQKAWNGVAILTKLPVSVTQTGLPGQADNGARLISARVGEGDDAIDFTTVYCPNGKSLTHADYTMKLGWYDSLIEHWSSTVAPTDQAVLCGDFNIVPTALDTFMGEKGEGDVFHTEAERSRLDSLLQTGLIDLYRDRYPDEQTFSWWDYRGGAFHRKMGLRIDFILGTPALRERVVDVVVDRDYRKKKEKLTASDHAPVIAELN